MAGFLLECVAGFVGIRIGRGLAERGNDLAHILRDGTIEPNEVTEERLLALTRQTDADLFAPRTDRGGRAYRNQGLRITRNRR